MVLDRRRILETALFDLEQIVTVQYLSRHANLSIDDAKDELSGFLKQNKSKTALHAVYVVSGELNIPDSASSSTTGNATFIHRHYRTQLVRDCDLERIRQTYKKVETCEIYCLHTKPIKSLCLLYSVDSLEDHEYERTDPERSWLCYPEAEIKRQEMLAHYDAASVFENQKKRTQKDSPSSAPKSAEPVAKKTKNNLSSLLVQAANKQEKTSLVNGVSRNDQKDAHKRANIKSGETIKRRGERVIIKSKDHDMKDKTELPQTTGENVVESAEIKTLGAKATLLTQDDLFSDGDSDPGKNGCGEIREMKDAEEKDIKKRPQFPKKKSSDNENCESQRKAVRKEYVTETFLDNDGFMVTKQVLKEIELEPSSTNISTEALGKTENNKLLNSKERKNAKVPQKQAKISSFFQKR